MSFAGMLNHKCDIYHLKRRNKSPGYGLPSSPSFYYAKKPDLAAMPCHFNTKSGRKIVQGEPQANYEAEIKLSLPAGTDIRLNDKIVDCVTGYEYTAEIPQDIRGHHIAVYLHRTGQQEAL